MRVLVIGGAGYVGCHAARALHRAGHDVMIYDNLSSGHEHLVTVFDLVKADIADTGLLESALRKVDAVMHFAANAYVGESVNNPRKYFDNNVRKGLLLLNAVVDAGVRFLVFSSSCAVYGVPPRMPIREDTPRIPVNPYGATKLCFENALEAYGHAYGLCSASLRYFNAAGADESGEIGELHEPETHLIPLALEAARTQAQELEIFGTDYPTPDGTCIRDYIHVNDLANAHALALEYMARTSTPLVVNLGTGRGVSVRELLKVVEEVTGSTVPVREVARRAGDPPILVADPTRAGELLSWKATRSVDDIVGTAWHWMKQSMTRSPGSVPLSEARSSVI